MTTENGSLQIDLFPGQWLRRTGDEADVVISSRARLARNVHGYPFQSRASEALREQLNAMLVDRVRDALRDQKAAVVAVNDLDEIDCHVLVEKHLISREHADGEGSRSVVFTPDEVVSIMINEEDHLRMQAIRPGFSLTEAWHIVDEIDNALAEKVPFAFSDQYGFLTACPTNVGTGLRVSVMLHLPALAISEHLQKVLNAVNALRLAARGLYGEHSKAQGDLYQISNQITLGRSEQKLLENVETATRRIIEYERLARSLLLDSAKRQLEDRVWRAYGVLTHARVISSEEAIRLLSYVRLGVVTGIIQGIDMARIGCLFVMCQPAHIQKLAGRELSPEERGAQRATFLREQLKM